MGTIEPILVDTKTACDMLGIKRVTLFRYLREGTLVRVKLSRKTVMTVASIKALAETGAA